jgi:hypothetical protein
MATFEFHAMSLILSWKLVVHWKNRHMCRWPSGKLGHGPSSIVIRRRFFVSQAVCPMYKKPFSCGNISFNAEEIPDRRCSGLQLPASIMEKWPGFVRDSKEFL